MQASGDTQLLNDLEQQQEQTAKQISRITGTGMRREGLFGGGMCHHCRMRPVLFSWYGNLNLHQAQSELLCR